MKRLGLFIVVLHGLVAALIAEEPDGSEEFARISVNTSKGLASRFWELTNSSPERSISVTYKVIFPNPAWRPVRLTTDIKPESTKFLGRYLLQGTTFAVVSTKYVEVVASPSPTPSPLPAESPSPSASPTPSN